MSVRRNWRSARLGGREAEKARGPGDEAVDRKRRERAGFEVAHEVADGDVGGDAGDDEADRELAVDVVSGVAGEARELEDAGGTVRRALGGV